MRHPGNVSPLAEANFAHDARAARLVVDAFSSDDGDRLVIAPLDVTMAGAVDHVHVASELDRAGVAQRLLANAWRTYIGNYCTVLKECGPTAVLHDAHTVATFAVRICMIRNVIWRPWAARRTATVSWIDARCRRRTMR